MTTQTLNPDYDDSPLPVHNDSGQISQKIQIALRHPVGERLRLVVGAVVPFGFFAELEPGTGFDALCHMSHIHGLGNRSLQDVFHPGMTVDCTVAACNITLKQVRVQLSCEAPPVPEGTLSEPDNEILNAKLLIAGLVEIASNKDALAALVRACIRTGRGLAASPEVDVEQWLTGNWRYAHGLFDGLKRVAKDMPRTRSLVGSLFGLKPPSAHVDFDRWIEENPQASAAAHAWLSALVRERPLHISLLGELSRRFGVPKPVSGWVSRFSEFAVLGVAQSPIRQPAVAIRERMEMPEYWGAFLSKLPPETPVAPARDGIATTVLPGDASASAPQGEDTAPPPPEGGLPSPADGGCRRVFVDGSNYIRSETGAKGLAAILAALKKAGRAPVTIFDAATPFKVDEEGKALIQRLAAAGEAFIAPGGSQADDHLLLMADTCGGDIISNDLYRDKAERYPWVSGDGDAGKRVHTAMVANGLVLIPDLDICSPVDG